MNAFPVVLIFLILSVMSVNLNSRPGPVAVLPVLEAQSVPGSEMADLQDFPDAPHSPRQRPVKPLDRLAAALGTPAARLMHSQLTKRGPESDPAHQAIHPASKGAGMNRPDHPAVTDLEAAVASPSQHFGSPAEVLAAEGLDHVAKRRILESWIRDAEMLAEAASEGMTGGGQNSQQEAQQALAQLEKQAAGR